MEELKKAGIRAGVNAGVNAAVAGKGFGIASRDALLTGVVSLGAGFLSSHIGKMYNPENPDGTPNQKQIGYWEHKLMHAGLGGLTAAALGNDIGSGAVGGAVGTMVADAWIDHQVNSALITGTPYDPDAAFEKGVALSGLVGAFGAYLIGGDPAESARAAQLAVETNCLPLLFAAASMVWLAVDLYDAYKAGGVDAVVTELGKQIAIQIAGGAIMKGVIAGARHLLMSPTSKKIFGKMMELIDDTPFAKEALDQGKALAGKALDQGAKLMDRFDQSKLGKFLNMLDAKLTEFSLLTAEQLKNLYLTPVLQGAGQAGGKIAAKGAVKAEGHAAEDVLEAVEDEAIKRYNKYKVPNRKEYGKDIPLNPGDDPNWSSKIWGTAQKTGTPGHAETCIHIAVIMSRDPNVAQVVLNRGYHLVTGLKIAPNRRPDVFVKYKDGTYKVFEVPSKTDFVDILQNRNEIAMKMLPEHMRGKVLVKPIATLEELMEKFLERK